MIATTGLLWYNSLQHPKFREQKLVENAMDDTKQPTDQIDELDEPDDIEEWIIPLDKEPQRPQGRLPFAKRLTFRQRKIAWRLSIAFSLLLLIILVAPDSLVGVRNVTTQLYNRLVPPPTPPLSPDLDSIYFDVNIPWT